MNEGRAPRLEALVVHSRGLAVSVKRTYRILPGGRCAPAVEQVPLVEEIVFEEGDFLHDTDLLSFKPGTDVVVFGSVHAPGGRTVRELRAAVRVGRREHAVRVTGRRKVVRQNGAWAFSDPEPFTERRLGWKEAYGGIDGWARPALDAESVDPLRPWVDVDLSDVTFAAYPRNPVGRGFVVWETREIEGMALPTVEDPHDLVTPGRLVAGSPDGWPFQPVAAGFGFLSYGWFPRSAFCGLDEISLPPGVDPASARVLEIERGHVPPDVLTGRPPERRVSDRAGNGAVPQLVFEPHLHGDEELALENLDAREPRLAFQLPGERPRIAISPLGEGEREVPVRLVTVDIDASRRMVSLVWGASVVPKYPHGPQNASSVPYRVSF